MAKANTKNQRREAALKKAKRQKLMLISFCAVAAAAVITFVIHSAVRQSGTETYSGGGLSVQLLENGQFSATLAHNVRKNGTYTKTADGNRVMVSFHMDGAVEVGWIEDKALRVPAEWEDSCGHQYILPRR
jgi:hypothetical protein